MAKKPSGLGRSLGELLEDNTPQVRVKKGDAALRQGEESIRISAAVPAPETPEKPKSLYETGHRNKSVKANFKTFK